MKTATKKPARSIRLVGARAGQYFGIQITVGNKFDHYICNEIPAYTGRGFQLEKMADGTTYNVLAANGQDGRCDCIGHEMHGRCKHLDGLRALLAAGKI